MSDPMKAHSEVTEEKIKEELQTIPKYQEYFKKFPEKEVKNFIDAYARKKYYYLNHGERSVRNAEYDLTKYQREAETRLWHIQEKKLFNAECRWRA